ncbi:MAG: exosortase system-associated protein, TIGR04073 family [Candidatus Omnitrophota bacterium]
MKIRKTGAVVVIILAVAANLMFAHPALAQDPIRKLGRGIANLGLGWISFLTTIEETGKSDGVFAGATYGLLKGIAKTIQRTAAGAYETVTFPIPFPKNYAPILTHPEFPLGKDAVVTETKK